MNANLRASGDQEPDALKKLSASKCGSALGPVSFFTTSPVFASATYRSTVNSPRRAKNATQLAVRAERRRDVHLARLLRTADEPLADVLRLRAALDQRQVRRADRRHPLLRQRSLVDADHAPQRRVPARRAATRGRRRSPPDRPTCRRCTPRAPGRSGTGRSAGRSSAARWSAARRAAPHRASTLRCADRAARATGTPPSPRSATAEAGPSPA